VVAASDSTAARSTAGFALDGAGVDALAAGLEVGDPGEHDLRARQVLQFVV
jgi:hypothetical protein